MATHNQKLPLYIAKRMQRGVVERFLKGDIQITDDPADIAWCCLDKRGKRRFKHCRDKMLIETVIGIARLEWKSDRDRQACIQDQQAKNKRRTNAESRWTDTMALAEAIRQGAQLPLPALVHPELHDHDGLRIIDGARRVIAHVEAGRSAFRVVIVRPKQKCSEGIGRAEQESGLVHR